MPRPISWLHRLHEIRRSVTNSVRSHFGRRDLEALFELQPRAAQKLLELLPTVPVGTSRLAEREALLRFLEGVQQADDVPAYLEALRQRDEASPRRKLRSLVQIDLHAVSLSSLPESMTLSRGRLEISFRSVDQLALDMFTLVRILDAETDLFAQLFEPEPPPAKDGDEGAQEVAAMFRELEAMELARKPAASSRNRQPQRRHEGGNV